MSQSTGISSQEFVTEIIDKGSVGRVHVLVVGICLILNLLDGFDITAMAVVASAVSSELELTPDKLGWIFSFALMGMMVGALFLTPLADIFGRRRLILSGVTLVGISILFTANATSLTEFVILRFISGIGAGVVLASQATLVAEYSPEKYRSMSVTLVTMGYPLGALFTSVAAGILMPEYGWRGMFWFGGGMTIFMVTLAFFLVPESLKYLIEQRPTNSLERVNKILGKLGKNKLDALPLVADSSGKAKSGFRDKLKMLVSKEYIGITLPLWATFFLCFATIYFLMSWIPKLMEDSGYSREVGRQGFFLFNLGGLLGTMLLAWMSTRWKLTNLIFVTLFGSAVSMVIFALMPSSLTLMYVVIFIIGFLQQSGFNGLYGVAAKAYPTEIRSTGVGWAIGLGRSGAVAGPAIAGYMIAAGMDMSANFFIFAIPMALGGLLAFRLNIR